MAEPKPNILELFLEAEENLLAQFDPSSDTFHRGDPRPVPVGGERVPESMPTAYDYSGTTRDTPMDPAYCYLVETRAVLIELKKDLSQVCPAVDGILRAHKFRDVEKKTAALMERQRVLGEVLEKVNKTAGLLIAIPEYAPNYNEMLMEVHNRALLDYSSKQAHAEFMQFMTLCTQRVFKDSQIIMQKIKSLY